jgi:hypothetical protein
MLELMSTWLFPTITSPDLWHLLVRIFPHVPFVITRAGGLGLRKADALRHNIKV